MNNLYEEMNVFLADQVVLGMKVHNVHWFLKGKNFFTIHEKMDEYYEAIEARIDEVAERMLAIGAKPVANLSEILKMTSINELGQKEMTAEEGLTTLVVDYATVRNAALRLIELAEEANDPGTADYFTSVTQDIEKDLWMMNAFLK